MTKKKAMDIVKWTTFGFMLFMGLLSLIVGSQSGALLYLVTGFFASPLSRKIGKSRKAHLKPGTAFLIGFLLFCSSSGMMLSASGAETVEKIQADPVSEVVDVITSEKEDIVQTQTIADSEREVLSTAESDEIPDELNIHFIDVGQGDATLITCGTHGMLIDAGNNDKGTAVQLYLNKRGIGDQISLDYVVGTHPDADHVGGLDVIITKFEVGNVLLTDYSKDTKTYQEVLDAIDYRNYKVTSPAVGNTYLLGDASFTIIAPNSQQYAEANDSSIGILLEHGNKRFLFSGDAEQEAEEDIVGNGIDISNIDVYKVGHHGSSTSSSGNFLSAMNPEFAVISLGEGNTYGHPHAEVLNNLRSAGIKLFRTDEQGSITATSDGNNITWNCAPTESWQAGEATKSSSTDAGKDRVEVEQTPNQEIPAASNNASTANGDTIVHITKTGECYHNAGCNSLSRTDIEVTLDTAKSKGLRACKNCNPIQ